MSVLNIVTTQLAAGRGPDEWTRRTVEKPIDTAVVQQKLNAFLQQVSGMFAVTISPLGEFQMEEVSFTAEVGPDGDFRLVGTGEPAFAGGVRFTLKRKHTMQTADLMRLLVGTEPIDDVLQNRMKVSNYVRGEADGQPVVERASNYVRGEADGQPVKVQVTGTVPVAEQNLPQPVVIAGS